MKKLMISIITILVVGILIVVCMRYFRGGAVTNQEILTDEEILTICKAAATLGIRHLKVTGGEPLLRKNVVELIGKIKKNRGN